MDEPGVLLSNDALAIHRTKNPNLKHKLDQLMTSSGRPKKNNTTKSRDERSTTTTTKAKMFPGWCVCKYITNLCWLVLDWHLEVYPIVLGFGGVNHKWRIWGNYKNNLTLCNRPVSLNLCKIINDSLIIIVVKIDCFNLAFFFINKGSELYLNLNQRKKCFLLK